MDYIDELSEDCVKEAIKSLIARGGRCHSGNVPIEAVRILIKQGRGRVHDKVAWAKVDDAVERLKERKELKAPLEREHDSALHTEYRVYATRARVDSFLRTGVESAQPDVLSRPGWNGVLSRLCRFREWDHRSDRVFRECTVRSESGDVR